LGLFVSQVEIDQLFQRRQEIGREREGFRVGFTRLF